MGQIKVLYIAGANRCGSTLLARLLGDLPGFVAIGEGLVHFFRASADFHVPCGCGLNVRSCAFWRDVSIPRSVEQSWARWLRLRRAPLLDYHRRRHPEQTSELISSLSRLYEAIAERAGAEVIVDSSKSPLHARMLSWVPNIDLHVVFLVRDPRSVVFSCSKPKEWLPGASPLRATKSWMGLTLGSEYLRTRVPQWRTLRYEDFVREPKLMTLQIAADLGYGSAQVPFINESLAQLGPQHMLGSNPDKFKSGPTRIVEQSASLPWGSRALVSILTAPLLWRYGYWGKARRKDSEAVTTPVTVVPEMVGEVAKRD